MRKIFQYECKVSAPKGDQGAAAFSLIEIVLAIAVFAFALVAVVGLLGLTSRATSEVLETTTAARIADGVRAELRRLSVDDIERLSRNTDPNTRLRLFATSDGERVLVGQGQGISEPPADNNPTNPPTGVPRGIHQRDRFFRIEIEALPNELSPENWNWGGPYDDDRPAYLPLTIRVTWPHNRPAGPPPEDPTSVDQPSNSWIEVNPENQSTMIFNTVVLRR